MKRLRLRCESRGRNGGRARRRRSTSGRKQRLVSTPIRRALWSRDRHCTFPGCHRTRFVQAHHVHHWIDGGATERRQPRVAVFVPSSTCCTRAATASSAIFRASTTSSVRMDERFRAADIALPITGTISSTMASSRSPPWRAAATRMRNTRTPPWRCASLVRSTV